MAWWFATYNVEFVGAIEESTYSSGENSILALTRRIIGLTVSWGGSRRRSIVAATKVVNREQIYCQKISTPIAGFRGGQRVRAQGPPPKWPPTMFMCLAICTAYACHFVIFSEESLFADAISYRSARWQYFSWILFGIVTKQLLHLPNSWK